MQIYDLALVVVLTGLLVLSVLGCYVAGKLRGTRGSFVAYPLSFLISATIGAILLRNVPVLLSDFGGKDFRTLVGIGVGFFAGAFLSYLADQLGMEVTHGQECTASQTVIADQPG